MADSGLRDRILGALGDHKPGAAPQLPEAAPKTPETPPTPTARPQPTVLVTPPPPAAPLRAIFDGHRTDGRDALGIDETIRHLAELAAHRGTRGPLCIGLLGGPGTGKTFALSRLAARIADLAVAAGTTAQSPYVSRIHVQAIDVSDLGDDPALGLAARLHAGLREPYPALAQEVAATARDPHVVLRDANERLDEARRRLDSERRALDDAGSRRARLTETVLYEAAGSQVDAYARANRAGIESRLKGFGLAGDPIRTYKHLVQLVAESGGTIGLALRALWAFKGQTKLIVIALAFVVAGIGLGIAIDDKATWLASLHGSKPGASVGDWLDVHIGLLATAKTAAFALAALALVANVIRAAGFLRPILKGANLLERDLDARRNDLDSLYAHQTKRVDTLDQDVERLTNQALEAERRAGGNAAQSEPSPFGPPAGAAQAQGIFATLAGFIGKTPSQRAVPAPERVVLALDHLDALPPEQTRAILHALHRMAGPGIVTLASLDPARIDPDGTRRAELERCIQVPVRLDLSASQEAYDSLIRDALGHGERLPPRSKPEAGASRLDAPVGDEEAALLVSLADLAGRTPRAVKRFANLYLLARPGDARRHAILAFMLALAQGGTDQERKAVADAMAGEPASPFDLPQADRRLRDALSLAIAVGGRVTKGEASDAYRRAATFSLAPALVG